MEMRKTIAVRKIVDSMMKKILEWFLFGAEKLEANSS